MTTGTSSVDVAYQIRKNTEEYQDFLSDLTNWQSEVKEKEGSTQKAYARTYAPPPVRSTVDVELRENKQPKIKAYDYRAWDKFDVEKACEDVDKENAEKSADTEYKSKQFVTAEDVERATIEKEKGNAHFKKGDYKKAIICYTRGISYDPDNAVLYTNRSMAHLKLERWNDAIQDCTKAIDLDPKCIKAYWRRGSAKIGLGQLKEGCEDLRMASVLDPGNKTIRADYQNALEKLKPKSSVKLSSTSTNTSVATTIPSSISAVQPKPLGSKETKVDGGMDKKQEVSQRRRLVVKEIGSPTDYVLSNQNAEKKPIETLEIRQVTKPLKKTNIVDEEKSQDFNSKCHSLNSVPAKESSSKNRKIENETTPGNKSNKILIEEVLPAVSTKGNSSTSKLEHQNQPISSIYASTRSLTRKEPPKNMVDFERDWKSIHRDDEALYDYLKMIDPKSFPKLLKSAFESSYLIRIGQILKDYFVIKNNDIQTAFDILYFLSQVPRFDMIIMFLSRKEKKVFESLFEFISNTQQNLTYQNEAWDVQRLRKKYLS